MDAAVHFFRLPGVLFNKETLWYREVQAEIYALSPLLLSRMSRLVSDSAPLSSSHQSDYHTAPQGLTPTPEFQESLAPPTRILADIRSVPMPGRSILRNPTVVDDAR